MQRAGCARGTAAATFGGIFHALEPREDRERRILAAAHFDRLAEAAAEQAGAARIAAQFLAPEDERGHGFGDFDGNGLHARRIGRRRNAVMAPMRAHAAALEILRQEARALGVRAGDARPCAKPQAPARAGALCRGAARHGFFKTAESDIGQHLADQRARGHG